MPTKNTKINIQTGKLLIAEPFMLDPNFKRSVILLCEHQEDGTVGFILNKSVNMKITDLLAGFPDFDAEVYFGGPVQTDTIHFIHNVGDLLSNSYPVADGVWWGGDFDELKTLVNMGFLEPQNIRFFVGYSGWSAGQLISEMRTNSWILSEGDPNFVFNPKYFNNNLWSQVLQHKGDVFSVIAQVPEVICLS
jgi:putative transcriptional regulator